ncbi:ABC transporter ATP-binding protein [Nocardioides campestrisoli]|uniref:ABC transporter ATP-binding protein n=1 Tax=Nocardioides campestrisoli TaxID=2736757 RepID=UPI00163DE143|nr:ABC transporter ATP-binding protein [Nocardioides campestrisoli]
MIELRDIRFCYPDRRVLDGVDLTIEEGELVLLAGSTGAGKSTLLGVLAGLVPEHTGGTLTGDVLLDGVSILHRPARERAADVGYVGQNPAAWFVTDTVEEELAYGMEQLGLPAATMRRRVEETLDLLGIADLRHRDLRTLSGGEQQRVAIGSVLTMHPRLLVLDEPTSALDPTAAEDVLAIVTRLVQDLGLSVVVAEHRLERVVPFADRMVLLGEDRRVRVDAPEVVMVDSPIAPPLVELGRALGWTPLPLTVRDARRRAREVRPRLADGLASASGTADPPPDARPPDPLMTASGLVVAHGRTPVLRGLDLRLDPGQVTALMGRNGAGKSTLLWALQGRTGRASGQVRVAGRDPHELSGAERRRRTGMVPQTAADLLYLESVGQECADADADAGAPGRCREILDRLAPGIEDQTHPRDLSEGQRLALALAVVLAARPPVLLLDEPTRGLDYPGKRALAVLLRQLAAEGRAVLVATHDVEFVASVADAVVVLADGEVVSEGPTLRVVVESPSFAPQVHKVLGAPWLRVDQVADALAAAGAGR